MKLRRLERDASEMYATRKILWKLKKVRTDPVVKEFILKVNSCQV